MAEFEKTRDYIINHIRKTFTHGDDIAYALEKDNDFDFTKVAPSIRASLTTGTQEEVAQYEKESALLFQSKVEIWTKHKSAYEGNKMKAYALLWERCASNLTAKILSNENYKSAIKGNPMKLLKAIELYSLNFQESRYKMSIMINALRALLGSRQQEGESLQDYTRRFKTNHDVFIGILGGTIEYRKYMEGMEGWDENKKDDIAFTAPFREKAWGELMAYLYMDNCNKAKYGSLIKGIAGQYSLKNNQYPKSVTSAYQALATHPSDKLKATPSTTTASGSCTKSSGDDNDDKQDGEAINTPDLTFIQMEGKCYCCGLAGHQSDKCQKRDSIPRDQWAINKAKNTAKSKAVQNLQTDQADEASIVSHTPRSDPLDWLFCNIVDMADYRHYSFHQTQSLKEALLLNTQSTVHMYALKKYTTDIWTEDHGCQVLTNGGKFVTHQRASTKYFGLGWYHEKALTNILSYALVEDLYQITYDQKKSTFTVHIPGAPMNFTRNQAGLYVYVPTTSEAHVFAVVELLPKRTEACFSETVRENKLQYTSRQVRDAKRARALYQVLGRPSIEDFKHIVKFRMIENNPVTLQDIQRAETIYGPDIGSLKGKTTRKAPSPIVKSIVAVPETLLQDHQHIELCMDVFTVNTIQFLLTVSK